MAKAEIATHSGRLVLVETSIEQGFSDFQHKLILGASSWGNNYGINNRRGLGSEEVNQILQRAHESGMIQIDTSPDYGDSEKLIGIDASPVFQFYSKVNPESWKRGSKHSMLDIHKSLRRLRTKKLDGIMFHSSSSMFDAPDESSRFMRQVVSSGLAGKWGVSVYEVEEVERILEFCKPDFIQLPSSLADRRFSDSGIISQLFTESIEVHTRSIFLQGLILQKPASLPKKFKRFSSWATDFENFSRDCALSKYQLALLFNLTNPEVSKVLVGVNSLAHLEEVLEALDRSATLPVFDSLPPIEDLELIDPRRWTS